MYLTYPIKIFPCTLPNTELVRFLSLYMNHFCVFVPVSGHDRHFLSSVYSSLRDQVLASFVIYVFLVTRAVAEFSKSIERLLLIQIKSQRNSL